MTYFEDEFHDSDLPSVEEELDYIFERLLEEGVVVKKEDIDLILSIQDEFLIMHGIIEPIEEDGEDD